jgi:hypothetical protein
MVDVRWLDNEHIVMAQVPRGCVEMGGHTLLLLDLYRMDLVRVMQLNLQ